MEIYVVENKIATKLDDMPECYMDVLSDPGDCTFSYSEKYSNNALAEIEACYEDWGKDWLAVYADSEAEALKLGQQHWNGEIDTIEIYFNKYREEKRNKREKE